MSAAAGTRLVVLAYHAIADHREDEVLGKWSVTPELFARQLEAIAAGGWTFVDLDTVLGALRGEAALPRRSVLLSFDDAYADFRTAACPAMAKHRAPSIVFVVAGKVGGTNSWDHETGTKSVELLDADGLRAVAAQSVEIGSHTTGHRPLPRVPPDELADELVGSSQRLQELGFPRPRALAYPYGMWTPEVAAAVADAGYEVAFTIQPGALRPGEDHDPFTLPRVVVLGTDTPRKLRWKLRAAAWPWPVQRRFLRLFRLEH